MVQGLSAPLTVVTGPPGTGKSQVVTSILVNLAWQGGSALFSSKNNHAVDVVESRVNELGPYPLLLRLGKEEHHARIAQQLTSGLADSSTADAAARHDWLTRAHEEDRARFAALQREIASVVRLRNAVDELERAAEPARNRFGEERFGGMRWADLAAIRRRLQSFAAALDAARGSGGPAVVRMLRDTVRGGRRFELIGEAAGELLPDAALLGAAPPGGKPDERNLAPWEEFRRALADRLEWAARAQDYWRSLDRLTRRPTARAPGARPDPRLRRVRAHFARIVAIVAPPLAQPLESGKAQAARRICVPSANDRRRGSLRRRRCHAGISPLLQPLSQGREDPALLGGDFAFGARTASLRSQSVRPRGDRRGQPVRHRFGASASVPRPARHHHRRPAATQAREHGCSPTGSPDPVCARASRGARGLGLFGQLAIRPRPQPVPLRRYRHLARSSPLAPRHHFVFEPALLSRRASGCHGSRELEASARR